jgi:hypothetical protein
MAVHSSAVVTHLLLNWSRGSELARAWLYDTLTGGGT